MIACFRPVNGWPHESNCLRHLSCFYCNGMTCIYQCTAATDNYNVSKHEIKQHRNGPKSLSWLFFSLLWIWFTAAMATIRHDLAPVSSIMGSRTFLGKLAIWFQLDYFSGLANKKSGPIWPAGVFFRFCKCPPYLKLWRLFPVWGSYLDFYPENLHHHHRRNHPALHLWESAQI